MATGVLKLLNIVGPDVALFGEKDYQQLAVIRRVVRDLFVPVQVVGVPTVREADGLALSSRNARLSPEDRAAAPVLHRALGHGAAVLRAGQPAEMAERSILAEIGSEPRARDAHVDIVDAETFRGAGGPLKRPLGIMVSARFGDVLLIDQVEGSP